MVNWRRDDAPYEHVDGERLKLLRKGFMSVVNKMMRTGEGEYNRGIYLHI